MYALDAGRILCMFFDLGNRWASGTASEREAISCSRAGEHLVPFPPVVFFGRGGTEARRHPNPGVPKGIRWNRKFATFAATSECFIVIVFRFLPRPFGSGPRSTSPGSVFEERILALGTGKLVVPGSPDRTASGNATATVFAFWVCIQKSPRRSVVASSVPLAGASVSVCLASAGTIDRRSRKRDHISATERPKHPGHPREILRSVGCGVASCPLRDDAGTILFVSSELSTLSDRIYPACTGTAPKLPPEVGSGFHRGFVFFLLQQRQANIGSNRTGRDYRLTDWMLPVFTEQICNYRQLQCDRRTGLGAGIG
ncbi:hypothetical protein ZHAS_00015126 [Anopheles sinensis]|uniref:Uncharacterized protein n=1 Tax=Anopheles sinensis TaxID=74873 RepID=A0A084WA38_ANOSI|nr:hypothetical protein ZHAS_00015126 [Anopheles sinensis]